MLLAFGSACFWVLAWRDKANCEPIATWPTRTHGPVHAELHLECGTSDRPSDWGRILPSRQMKYRRCSFLRLFPTHFHEFCGLLHAENYAESMLPTALRRHRSPSKLVCASGLYDLSWVHDVVWIESWLDHRHVVQGSLAVLFPHRPQFPMTNPSGVVVVVVVVAFGGVCGLSLLDFQLFY